MTPCRDNVTLAMLAMGDFNDEPFDTSLVLQALSTRQRAKVTSARQEPLLWNLTLPIAGAPDGSFYLDTSRTCSSGHGRRM